MIRGRRGDRAWPERITANGPPPTPAGREPRHRERSRHRPQLSGGHHGACPERGHPRAPRPPAERSPAAPCARFVRGRGGVSFVLTGDPGARRQFVSRIADAAATRSSLLAHPELSDRESARVRNVESALAELQLAASGMFSAYAPGRARSTAASSQISTGTRAMPPSSRPRSGWRASSACRSSLRASRPASSSICSARGGVGRCRVSTLQSPSRPKRSRPCCAKARSARARHDRCRCRRANRTAGRRFIRSTALAGARIYLPP
jgi:hypothetical protein